MAWFDRLRTLWVRWALWSAGMLLLIAATALCVSWRTRNLDARLREDLLEQATAIAQSVDPAIAKSLTFTPADKGTPAYERLRALLTAYGRLIPNRGIYTMALRDGQIVFGPENYPGDDPMASPPGTMYQKPTPEDFAIFQTGQAYSVGPVADEYGTFVSAAAPVFDPDTGAVLMAVGIDIPAEDWASALRAAGWKVIRGALPAFLLWAGLLVASLWRRGMPAPSKGRLFHLETALIATLGLYLTALAAMHGAFFEQSNRQALFRRLAQARLASVRAVFTETTQDLATLARYFESSEEVDRQEFAQFAQPFAQRSGVEACLWAPAVTMEDRAVFEETARRMGLADFVIWERDARGKAVPAPARDVYYPVFYTEPADDEVMPLGFDLASEPLCRVALKKALSTGLPTASAPLMSSPEPQRGADILLFQPVASQLGVQQKGFVVGALHTQALLEAILRPWGEESLLLGVGMIDFELGEPKVLAAYPRGHRVAHPAEVALRDREGERFSIVQPLFFAGRALALNVHPLPFFETFQPRRAAWFLGLAGLSLTAAISTLVSVLRRREYSFEKQVRERTIALEIERDRAQSYLDVAGVILLHLDREGRTTLINRRGLEILGCSAEEVIGKSWVDHFVPPEEREETRQVLRALAEEHANAADFEYHENAILTARGERRLIAWHNVLIRDREGRLQGVLSSGEDITERHRAEEALRQSEERYRLLAERAQDLIYRIALVPERRFEYVSPSAMAMVGYTPEEHYADPDLGLKIVHPEDRPLLARVAQGDFPADQPIVLRWVRKDGSIIWTEQRNVPVYDENGCLIAIEGIARDITERKRAEEERLEMERRLLQAQRLESLGVLAGGIAHDFNNLLMAVSGNLDLALLDLPAASPVRKGIEEALLAARRAADLTRQLLAYAGKGRFTLARLDVNAFMEENVQLFRTALPKTVSFALSLAPTLAPIEADPAQLQQVVMNLLTNAAEAIGDAPGTITLSTGIIEADAHMLQKSRLPEVPLPGRYVFLEVADTGCGMDEATIGRIFEPFFTTKFTGRGLGMAAVAGIVRGHHGAILIESAIGKGTTVRVLLPTVGGESGPQKPSQGEGRAVLKAAQVGESPNQTALVVDDEATVRQVAELMFRRMGFQAFSAASGEEALAFLRRQGEVTITLLDLSMPGMDGLATLAEMRRLAPGQKVILSSGYNEQVITQRLTSRGEAEFIQKPFDFATLRAAVERALGKAK